MFIINPKKKKVYLQVVPESPEFKLQESEVAAVQCNVLN